MEKAPQAFQVEEAQSAATPIYGKSRTTTENRSDSAESLKRWAGKAVATDIP